MGSLFGSAPEPPKPQKVAASQMAVNRNSAELGREFNRINQQGAFGGGVSYDPVTGAQTTTVGQYGQDAAGGLAGLGERYYGQAGQGVPDYTQGFQQAASFYDANMDPRLERSRAAVESRLRNQGLDPTSAAYKSAMNDLSLQQNEARNNWMAGAQNQFFNQGLQNRAQTMNELTPGVNAASTFMSPQVSPFAQIGTGQAPDMGNLYQNNYNQRLANYNNQMAGIGGLAKTGLSLLTAPMTGGLSLAGMGMNLAQGNPYNYGASWAPTVRFG
jgi:hypothetical protein